MKLIFGDPESIAIARRAAGKARKARKIPPEERHQMQIGEMHRVHGITEGQLCKNCVWFTYHQPGQNIYRKCKKFGITGGPATDWRSNYQACGLFQPNNPSSV